MAGINLSQASEKKKVSSKVLVDQGFIYLLVLAGLVLAGWGGLRYYIYSTNKEITSLQASIANYAPQLMGEKVDRVTDRDERLDRIEKNAASGTDAAKLMGQLERLTVPEVRITKYEYDQAQKIVHISGTTDNFRYIAAQIINFRSEAPLQNMEVEKLGNIDEGRIAFTLKASLKP